MDKQNETLSLDGQAVELNPGVQALADMADKMGEGNPEPEYNEFGFNKEGIHRNGTRYDDEGYGADGFDEDGVDREGFDREGFGSDDRDREGFDREGYSEDGYDRKGFNKAGIHKKTGTEYDDYGFNRKGFNRNGYNLYGYDEEGFHYNGFNPEGIHKVTGTEFSPNGWNKFRTVHRDTGSKYDPAGFDAFGYDRDGYDRYGWDQNGRNRDGYDRYGWDQNGINKKTGGMYDQNGFSRAGINKETGTKYDREGFDFIGLDKNGYDRDGFKFFNEGSPERLASLKERFPFLDLRSIKLRPTNERSMSFRNTPNTIWIQHSEYNKDGFDRDGYDRYGYNIDGYDRRGFDKEGYNSEGLDKDGYTREYNAKFNEYGVDENGYMKNGEIDPDIKLAISLSESGVKDQVRFAAEKGMDEKEVRDRIELARKKCPNIDEIIRNVLLTGNRMRSATVLNDCEKFIGGSLSTNEFWDKHPKLKISEVLSNFMSDPNMRKQFSDRTIESLVLDSDNIENNLRIFAASRYDVSRALIGIEDFKKTYIRFNTDGTPEQLQKKRENTKKIYDTIKYFSKYKSRDIGVLLNYRHSLDGGQTWIDFDGEAIGQALGALKRDGKLICTQTVKDYIISQSKSANQA